MPYRTLIQLLIAFLLLTQLSGLVHAYSHTLSEQPQETQFPNEKSCDLCTALTQLGHGATSNPVAFHDTQAYVCRHIAAEYFLPGRNPAFYTVRAPPCTA